MEGFRKRTLPEQCRWWESKLLEILKQDEVGIRANRSVLLGVALFLGELSEKLPEEDQ